LHYMPYRIAGKVEVAGGWGTEWIMRNLFAIPNQHCRPECWKRGHKNLTLSRHFHSCSCACFVILRSLRVLRGFPSIACLEIFGTTARRQAASRAAGYDPVQHNVHHKVSLYTLAV